MAKGKGKAGGPNITIIRKEEVVGGGHHGGAWKVAYADFVTAMMAFFLLMWLLNATTEAQRRGLADYFAPTVSTASSHSGSGRPLAGTSPFTDGEAISDKGAIRVMNATAPPVDAEDDGSDTPASPQPHSAQGDQAAGTDGQTQAPPATGPGANGANGSTGASQASSASLAAEDARLAAGAAALRAAIGGDPVLAKLAPHVDVDITQEGLRVQIKDTAQEAMFSAGSAAPSTAARSLLRRIAPLLGQLRGPISITGHTDSTGAAGGSNWDLSAARALAARRELAAAGLPDTAMRDVQGRADRDPLLPATPNAPANRRLAIVVLRQSAP